MLIRFTVENFRSINDEAVFSMLPGAMQKHDDHIIRGVGKNSIDVLPLALLYGANASGKSNLIKAMDFARDFIVDGVRPKKPIPVEPFRLNQECRSQPTKFEFEFIIDDQAYAYGFVLDRKRVHEEWLFEIDSKKERAIFERKTDQELVPTIEFDEGVVKREKDEKFLEYAAWSTRYNQLFLTKTSADGIEQFDSIFEWFKSLTIVFPESKPAEIEILIRHDKEFKESLSKFMATMSTGIDNVCLHQVSLKDMHFPSELLSKIFDELDEKQYGVLPGLNGNRYVIGLNEEGEQEIFALGTTRNINDGTSIDFDISDESDGTQRLIDLFPLFYSERNRVFVIDELEKSLHPNLLHRLLKWYLENRPSCQLIVTTHESTLLDLELLRRDEIWFTEKDQTGGSTFYSLEEFRPRADLDIRKGYLHGRFGAIPILGHSLDLSEFEARVA